MFYTTNHKVNDSSIIEFSVYKTINSSGQDLVNDYLQSQSHITNLYIPNFTLSTSQHYHECKFLKTVETIACNLIILHFLF